MNHRIKAFVPWFMAGAILLLLIALVIVGVLSYRGISANQARAERIATELDGLDEEMGQVKAEIDKLKSEIDKADAERDRLKEDLEELKEDISANADQLQEETTKAKLQVLLLKASAKTLKARIHLGEKEAGLAEPDLAECDTALEAAIALADEKAKIAL